VTTPGGPRIRFTPDADFAGTAGFDYTVSDGGGGLRAGSVDIVLANVNDAPVAHDDMAAGFEDLPLVFAPADLAANDLDVDGDPLAFSAVGNASGGTVALVGGQAVFTPDPEYAGPAGFDYTVADGQGGECSAHVHLSIAAVNDAPTVTGETILGIEETSLLIDPAALLANEADVDSPAAGLHITAVGGATHGSVELLADGHIQFVPEADFDGDASFSYTVADEAGASASGTATVHLANINDAPVALGETIATDEDLVLNLKSSLLANDTDVDTPHGDLTIVGLANASHCSVTLQADGSVNFIPWPNYSGAAAFDYTISDGSGGFATATARFNIAPVNDAPLVTGETITVNEDSIVHFSAAALLANDTDLETPGSLMFTGVGDAHGGTVSLAGDDITFTPGGNFNGSARFSYTVADPEGGASLGQVTINYLPVNDAPVANGELVWSRRNVTTTVTEAALLANDSDAEGGLDVSYIYGATGGSATLNADDSVTFVPNPGFTGRASFNYVVQDSGGLTAPATAQIDFSAMNHNPTATDDSFSGNEDTLFYIPWAQLTSNDHDSDSDALTVTAVGSPSHGTVNLDTANHRVVFTPEPNYHGPAEFRYTVADAYGGSTQAKVLLTINPVNDAPVIDRVEIHHQEMDLSNFKTLDPVVALGAVMAHDVDGDALEYTILGTGPTHGHASVLRVGKWLYAVESGDPYTGDDPFYVRVKDSSGAYADALVVPKHIGSDLNTGGGAPIVLDLDSNGIELIAPEDSSLFADINADGWRERIGWAGAGDAVLAYDADGDGRIAIIDEVSFVQYQTGARTDLEGLAGLDSSADGRISADDAAWSQMGLVGSGAVQDADGQVSDWISLDEAGVTAIGLQRRDDPHLDHGNLVFGTGTATLANGREILTGDVMLAGEGVPLPDEATALLAESATGNGTATTTDAAAVPAEAPAAPADPEDENAVAVDEAVTPAATTVAATDDLPAEPAHTEAAEADIVAGDTGAETTIEPAAVGTTAVAEAPSAAQDDAADGLAAPTAEDVAEADEDEEEDEDEEDEEDLAAVEDLAAAELASIQQQAQLFCQASATAEPAREPPLAFVPSQEPVAAVAADPVATADETAPA
jgi:hypothetical protein